MAIIKTSKGVKIKYHNRVLYGQKVINKPIAIDNLVAFKRVLDNAHIDFLIIAGTLLGAVREHDFISYDEDIDVALLVENKQKLFDVLPELLAEGFEIARYDKRNLLSVIRNGEYIDLYFFYKSEEVLRRCNGWLIPAKFLENTALISFKNNLFSAPRDYVEYLRYEYGETWQTPIKWFNYDISNFLKFRIYIKERAKEFLPPFVLSVIAKIKEKKFEKKFRNKLKVYQENGGVIA